VLQAFVVCLAAATLAACSESAATVTAQTTAAEPPLQITNVAAKGSRLETIVAVVPTAKSEPPPTTAYALASAGDARLVNLKAHEDIPSATKGKPTYGVASYYWQGSKTASGERFNPSELTAAHRTLPFGTRVRVTNLATERSVTVRINDRGPYVGGRVVDISRGAAQSLGMIDRGVTKVKLEVLQ
jgi:rare lipoprotein A